MLIFFEVIMLEVYMYMKCNYTSDHSITIYDQKIISNGQLNIKELINEQFSHTIPNSIHPFYAISDASNFEMSSAIYNHIEEQKKSTTIPQVYDYSLEPNENFKVMRKFLAIIYTNTEFEFFVPWIKTSNNIIHRP